MMMFNKSGRVVGVVHDTDSGRHGHVPGGRGAAWDVIFTAPRMASDSVLAALMRRFRDGTVSVRHGDEEHALVRHSVLFSGSVR